MTKTLAYKWVENGGTEQETDADGKNYARTNISTEVIAFGVSDKKGREYGASVLRFEFNLVPFVPRTYCTRGLDLPPGNYFAACVKTTRGGEGYGACQATNWFRTEADREAYIAERIARMKKAKK